MNERLPKIEDKLTNLAEKLLDGALSPNPSADQDPVDVFKTVAAWYVATVKTQKPEKEEPVGFAALAKELNGAAPQ
jgi:uncharacterized protein YozE (UPF0346 family)